MIRLAALGALALAIAGPAEAAAPGRCIDIAVPKGAVAEHGGKWTDLTPDQWQFLRGVYVVNPETAPGLPFGDKAALAQVEGNSGGLVFFIDGDKACTPMTVPHELLEMMETVAKGPIPHEGGL
jgi:hypothetical protein